MLGFLGQQVVIGAGTSLLNIAVHAILMALLAWAVHRTSLATANAPARRRRVLIMITCVSVLMVAHLLEVVIWGFVYAALHVVPQPADAFYFAFVNYTTLGYGDILPAARWRMLGPMAAMNGVLLFGWSTAVIYDVLRTVAQVQHVAARRI